MRTEKLTVEMLADLMERTKPYQLRAVNREKVEEYIDKHKAGIDFPAIIVAEVPVEEKKGPTRFILDGIHRGTMFGEVLGKNAEVTVSVEAFPHLDVFLAEMYRRNAGRGIDVARGDRDRRIRLLHAKPHAWSLSRIGEYFSLTKQACSLICREEIQEADPSKKGGKGGKRAKGKADRIKSALKDAKEGGPLQVLKWLGNVVESVNVAERRTALVKFVLPTGKDDEKAKAAKREARDLIRSAAHDLTKLDAIIRQGGEHAKKDKS